MSYIGQNAKFQTVTFRPRSADPLNPTEGMTQYADGTVRPEGVWVYKDSSWQKVGSAGVLNFDDFGDADSASLSNFSTGNNATFDGGGSLAGTFALSTTAADLINGTRVLKYTQAAGSLNDYINRATVAIPQGYRGRMTSIQLQYKYNGLDSDLRFVAKDQTNNTILFTYNLPAAAPAGNVAQELTVSFLLPTSCATLGYGFQVQTLNSGKVLIWDDVIVAPTDFLSLNTVTKQSYSLSQSSGSMTANSGNLRFNLSTATISSQGDTVVAVADNASGTRFTASATSSIQLTISALPASASTLQILKNGVLLTEVYSDGTGNVDATANVTLASGDYLSLRSNSGALSGTAYLTFTATALATSVITPASEYSSEKTLLTFKSTAIADTDKVGTFNTYTYASGGNVATVSGTAPTQTIADMQQNGVLVYARAYNATSTTAQPARFDIKLPKFLKNAQVASSALDFSTKQLAANGTIVSGTDFAYNPSTGILTITAGVDVSTLSTTRYVGVNTTSAATPTSAYFTFIASQKPELVGIPIDRSMYAQHVLTPPQTVQGMVKNAWTAVPLDTFSGDLSFSSVSGTQITLPAGTYNIDGFTSVGNDAQSVQIRIQDLTATATLLYGPGVYLQFGQNALDSAIHGTFTLQSTATIQFEYYNNSTGNGSFGTNSWGPNVTPRVQISYKITKVQ